MTAKTPLVRIQVLAEDGEWFTPSQVPAARVALAAIADDITFMPGTYSGENLREFRKALRDLDEVLSRRIG